MARIVGRDIIHRYERNPIIELEDLSFSCLNIMNAGAVKFGDKYILLVRIETMRAHSIVVAARSEDGVKFVLDEEPILTYDKDGPLKEFEEQGVADARITCIEDECYITYTALSRYGRRLGLAKTKDFKTIEKLGFISEPDNHNGALFPRKFNNLYARLERPSSGGNIWISYSKDMINWGRGRVIMAPRGDGFWDSHRIGAGVPPIEVEEGWLLIYYGVKETAGGPIFRLGTAILDKENPAKVIGRSTIPILSPREYYERVGDSENMVFTCGAVVTEDKELLLYYGGANMGINLGTASVKEICEECIKEGT